MDTFPVGYIVLLRRRRAEYDAFAETFLGAFFADKAKIPDPEFNRVVRQERQICQHFGKAYMWPEFGCDQQAVARNFPQSEIPIAKFAVYLKVKYGESQGASHSSNSVSSIRAINI